MREPEASPSVSRRRGKDRGRNGMAVVHKWTPDGGGGAFRRFLNSGSESPISEPDGAVPAGDRRSVKPVQRSRGIPAALRGNPRCRETDQAWPDQGGSDPLTVGRPCRRPTSPIDVSTEETIQRHLIARRQPGGKLVHLRGRQRLESLR